MYTQADPSGKQALLGKRPTVRGSLFAQNSQAVEPLTSSMIAIHGANPLNTLTPRFVLSEKIISGLGTKMQHAENPPKPCISITSVMINRFISEDSRGAAIPDEERCERADIMSNREQSEDANE